MKIKITETQLKFLLKEQEDPQEKILSSLEYATNKPFSCVEYEPIKIYGKEVFPKNYRKNVQYKYNDVDGDKKFAAQLTFFKEWKGSSDNVVVIKIYGVDKDKRFQQIEYAGKFNCTAREILINLTDETYYQADASGSVAESDLIKQSSPFSLNPFSGEINLGEYNTLDALGAEISKITFDHNSLNPI